VLADDDDHFSEAAAADDDDDVDDEKHVYEDETQQHTPDDTSPCYLISFGRCKLTVVLIRIII